MPVSLYSRSVKLYFGFSHSYVFSYFCWHIVLNHYWKNTANMLECRFHLPSPISRDLILISLLGALSDRNEGFFSQQQSCQSSRGNFSFPRKLLSVLFYHLCCMWHLCASYWFAFLSAQDERDELIIKRNEVQQSLYSTVKEFILEVDQLLISERSNILQVWQEVLWLSLEHWEPLEMFLKCFMAVDLSSRWSIGSHFCVKLYIWHLSFSEFLVILVFRMFCF